MSQEDLGMKRKVIAMLLIVITVSVVLATYVQPLALQNMTSNDVVNEKQKFKESGFDSDNITVTLLVPAINSTVIGVFNITLDVNSDN